MFTYNNIMRSFNIHALQNLIFSKVSDADFISLLPDALTDYHEVFTSDAGQFTKYTEGVAGTTQVVANAYEISHSGSQNDIITLNTSSTPMPQNWVEVQVDVTDTGATGYDYGGVGLVLDQDNYLLCRVDRIAGQICVQVKIAGSGTSLSPVAVTIPTAFKIGMSLVANAVTVWIDTGSGFEYKSYDLVQTYKDFKLVGALSGWKAGFLLSNGGGTSVWRYSNLKLGRHGGVGIRDLAPVTYEDGTPYVVGSTAYCVATLPDATGTCTQGVVTIDLDTYTYSVVSVVMINRGGSINNDIEGHIIYYGNGDRRITIIDGDLSVILHKLTTSDLLSGSNVESGLSQLSIAGPSKVTAMLAKRSDTNDWIIAYSEYGSSVYTGLAKSSDLISWDIVGVDIPNAYVGAKIAIVDNKYLIVSGGPVGSNSSRIYSADDMSVIGALNIEFDPVSGSAAFPAIIGAGDSTYCLSFDQTYHAGTAPNGTFGNLVIYKANS